MKTRKVLSVSSPASPGQDALRLRLLDSARELFLKNGFSRVTTDDVSAALGISKATLYKIFPSKKDLLSAIMQRMMQTILARVEEIIQDEKRDFIEKLVTLMTYLGDQLSRLGPVFARDIQRSAPGVWQQVDEFRRDKIIENFEALISAGIKKGVFQKGLNQNLLALMFVALMQEFINPETLYRHSYRASDIFETIIGVFFEGILTDKARNTFHKKKLFSAVPKKEASS
jgi:AcrR family transcriptional regulator